MFEAILCLILILAGMFGWMKFGGLFTGAKYSSDKNMYLVNPFFTELARDYWNRRGEYDVVRKNEIEYALGDIYE